MFEISNLITRKSFCRPFIILVLFVRPSVRNPTFHWFLLIFYTLHSNTIHWKMFWFQFHHSLRPSDAYMRQWTNHHWFREGLVAWTAPSHYLKQCWIIVDWTLKNKFQWHLNRNSNILIQENALEHVVCELASILSRPQSVKGSIQNTSASLSEPEATHSIDASTASDWIDLLLPSVDLPFAMAFVICHIGLLLGQSFNKKYHRMLTKLQMIMHWNEMHLFDGIYLHIKHMSYRDLDKF